MKKLLKLDFIFFALISLGLWIGTTWYIQSKAAAPGKYAITQHNYMDQYTLQALAWQAGRNDFTQDSGHLELALYKNKIYNSFPPVPSLIEFPLTLIFGQNTPNNLTMILFVWLAMLFAFFILEKLTGNRSLSFVGAFSFFWGTNIYYLSLSAPVWHQGQLYGLFFCMAAFLALFSSKRAPSLIIGGLCLGLAIGCRPFYFLFIPLFLFLAARKYPLQKVLLWTFVGLIPPGLFIGIYNYVRFDSPFNFGHVYLEYENQLRTGVFNLEYLSRNLYYDFLKMPVWDKMRKIITFDYMGNSILLLCPVLFLGFFSFFKRDVSGQDKLMAALSLLAVLFLLMLHHGNGRAQFGYRFSIDLTVIFLLLFGWGFKKLKIWMIPLCAYSIAANIYGALWYYVLVNNKPL